MAAKSTTNLLAVAALLVTAGACTPAFARSPRKPAGVRTGKATDAHPTGNMPHAAALPGPQAVPNLLDVPVAAVADPIDAIPALELQSLPLTGSAWQDLALGAPPAATRDRPDGSSSSRGGDAGVTVDGVSIRLAFGAIRLGSTRTRGVHLIGPVASESSIRQVEDASGGASMLPVPIDLARVRVATESGTNAVHGRGALFTRQSILSAQDPYSQWVRQTGAGTATTIPAFTPEPYTSSDTATIWSFGVGGPVRRNRMYWFASLNSRRRNHPGVATVRHPDHFFAQPSNDQMQVLSARLGLSSANPVVEGLAAYSGMLQTLAGLLGPASRAVSLWSGFGRFDWQAGSRFRLTLEGTGMHRDAPGAGLTRTSEMYGARSFGSHRSSEQWMLGRWEAVMTPHLLAVTQVSAARHIMDAPPQAPSAYEQTLNVNAWGQLPQISIDTRYGFTIGKPSRFGAGSYPDERMIQARQQVDWSHGGVLLQAGFDLSHNRDATSLLHNQTGTYSYSSVENFVSDALAFAAFGLNGQLDPFDQHNCDQTGRAWRDANGTLHGLGYLPCYSYYAQMMGPSNWSLSTNDWGGYVASRWQLRKAVTVSAAVRWDRQQVPRAIAALRNPDLPLTEQLPDLGDEWGPRVSLAWGTRRSHLPVLRLGYGLFFGRTPNVTVLTALTQTGSQKGDLNFFMRPTDNLYGGGAPPFPYVLAGEPAAVVKPDAVEFSPSFRNAEVHQAVATLEESLPGGMVLSAGGVVSLGRRLPVAFDANIDPASNPQTITYAVVDGNGTGPIRTPIITVPFYASWPSNTSSTGFSGRLNPNYRQVSELVSRANSTYEAAVVRLTRNRRHGLSLRARYSYAHAMDWNPDVSTRVDGPSVLDPGDFSQEYGASDLDMRHSATTSAVWAPRWKVRGWAGRLANGWMVAGIGYFRSGLPYSMRTSGALAREFTTSGVAIEGVGTGMNGYGGENRVYGVGRNTYRYPATWKADLRAGRQFSLGGDRQLELLAESYNLFNRRNVNRVETVGYTIGSGSPGGGLPTLSFLTGLKTGQTEFGRPLNANATRFYRPRQIQFGMRLHF